MKKLGKTLSLSSKNDTETSWLHLGIDQQIWLELLDMISHRIIKTMISCIILYLMGCRWKDLCRVSMITLFFNCSFLFILLYIYYSLKEWNTDAWLKRSASGKSNRNTADSGGKIARHTGGSISYDEHRIRFVSIHII